MLDVFATYSGSTVLASGTPPTLWPNDAFPSTGPSDEFLAANSAQRIISAVASTRYQKVTTVAPYVAVDGKIYDVQAVALSAGELNAALAAYQAARNAFIDSTRAGQIDAFMNPVDRMRQMGAALQLIKTRVFQQSGSLPLTWTGGQQSAWSAGTNLLTWFDAMTTTADNAKNSINAVTTAMPNCLDAVDAVVSGINWPAHP